MSTSNSNNNYLEIYFIAGTQDVPEGTLPHMLEAALKAGVTCFQYREKGPGSLGSAKERRAMAEVCQRICAQYRVPFIVNDDLELARAIGADGVHVGQQDRAIREVLQQFKGKLVGLSCYDEEEISCANQLPHISYYGIGPVFGTISKADAQPPMGDKRLARLIQQAAKPCVAIGGISIENAAQVWRAGPSGLAVISAVTKAPSVEDAVALLKQSKTSEG